MKNIIIDINVLMDFVFQRSGHESAALILKLCYEKKVRGIVCAHEITTLAYFLTKQMKDKYKIKKTLSDFLDMFEVIEAGTEILRQALFSPISDYEDAVIEASAKTRKVDYIVTRNLNDFKHSSVKALTPEKMLDLLRDYLPSA
ncbi:MAG: PIN domain-containing protein [Candidatus Margulisbacteria bacterium]|jgi:predicted nucleic acid-binding protein|nr:PIN domain-containing protein [Candidatus Margulisiibacteriota bacterium]